MKTTTTLFDLKQTAVAAAENAAGRDQLEVLGLKLEAFQVAGHDKLDFPAWSDFFERALADTLSLKNIPSPATAAAQAAAVPQAPSPAPKA